MFSEYVGVFVVCFVLVFVGCVNISRLLIWLVLWSLWFSLMFLGVYCGERVRVFSSNKS